MTTFAPGSLVRCRDREWVVLPSEAPDLLVLRPLGGSESDVTGIHLGMSRALGMDTVEPATFPPPDPALAGDLVSGRLLAEAARMLFRSGAGPFRSLGRINVRPRPFQLVPLLMVLRQDPVRLLIADDVGIGKTIEAGLIARELLDRGDVQRLCVLCPPHLCEQWQRELAEKFAIDAVVVRAGTLARLERGLPPGDLSVFEHYPALVVSIDFVKGDRRRDSFLRGCPDLVIVDEAHTAARAAGTRMAQQRHELLRDVARAPERHVLLLTATPHSGIEDASRSLLEVLNPAFRTLNLDQLSEQERRTLARHIVQRRRADVQRWLGDDDVTPFPIRESHERTYRLAHSPAYLALFDDIYTFARELVRDASGGLTVWKQRVRYWTALALLRCVMSSPAAAEATLRARIRRASVGEGEPEQELLLADYVLDLSDQEAPQDFDPTPVVAEGEQTISDGERRRLQEFARRAASLRGDGDPKLLGVVEELTGLLRDGFRPIVYCRYIATAEYLAIELQRRLQKPFGDLRVIAVTGTSSEDEREQRIAELAEHPRRLLVATDCLSEGVNLQHDFDAVLHYDLPWNPNRLEQREGRVDRYGQPAAIVRVSMFYGIDNPIDEAVLRVLLRKAVSIHKTLGISVPLPVDSESVVETVVRSLFQEQSTQQDMFASDPARDLDAVHRDWDRAAERERESRTRFAQHAIRPEEVAKELYESDAALGDVQALAAFVRAACERLGAPLMPVAPTKARTSEVYRLALAGLPAALREQLNPVFAPRPGAKAVNELLVGFQAPLPEGAHLIGRLHPLTETLADYLVGLAIEAADPLVVSRSGVIRSQAVARRTTILLLRLRLLIETPGRAAPMLVEELILAGFEGRPGNLQWLAKATVRELLLTAEPSGNLAAAEQQTLVTQALAWLPDLDGDIQAIANARAAALLESHRRVRQVSRTGRVVVRPNLPVDLFGVYVLMPVPKGMVS